MEPQKQPPVPVLSTILMAIFLSVLCVISLVIYLALNWQNPIWTGNVKLILSIAAVVMLGVLAGLMVLYRKITR